MNKKDYYNDQQWKNLRKARLSENPYCLNCACFGKSTPATEVHHIIKFYEQDEADRYTLFLDRENTICLCSACHKDIHGRKKFQQPRFSQYVYDMKNYLCQKYLAQGKIIRYTEDKNRRPPINKEKSKLF